MRKLKVEEVRFSGRDVVAAPEWAFEAGGYGRGPVPIEKAWVAVRAEMERRLERDVAESEERKRRFARAKEDGTGSGWASQALSIERQKVFKPGRVLYVSPYASAKLC